MAVAKVARIGAVMIKPDPGDLACAIDLRLCIYLLRIIVAIAGVDGEVV
jgi:hypothetical protein